MLSRVVRAERRATGELEMEVEVEVEVGWGREDVTRMVL